MNPIRDGAGLKLNISETDNSQSLKLAMNVAGYFGLDETEGKQIIEEVREAASKWRVHAKELGVSSQQQQLMARAFRAADRSD